MGIKCEMLSRVPGMQQTHKELGFKKQFVWLDMRIHMRAGN